MAGAARQDEPEENDTNSLVIPNLETQKNEIGELLKKTLEKGDTWYLLECHWLKQWKKYVGFDSWDVYEVGEEVNNPGPIDNSNLFIVGDSNFTLKEHLIEELYYNLVPEEAWNKLLAWYGIVENQPSIPRKVVEYGMYVKHCKVEVYLIEFKLCQNSDMEKVVTHQFSKADTLEHIENVMKELFEIPKEAETRLWNKYMRNTFELLSNKDQTVQDVGLYQGQTLVIEQKNEDGTWQRTNTRSSYASSTITSSNESSSSGYGSSSGSYGYSYSSSGSYWGSLYDGNRKTTHTKPGLTGLGNLGNTCFMNSGLQCLSNTMMLTKYFLSDQYKAELNVDNPLGMRGEIAKAYAELLAQLWSGSYSSVAPRNFKTQVGRFAPQFSGYQQQDSQELLAFLLDGLHEDLNRIKKKPYIEIKDANGRPDKIVAQETWFNHRQRNDSIIVDIFHAQFKSTLVCPECNKVSVTFDPFCYLSLPLPVKKERPIEFLLFKDDPMEKPVLYKLSFPKLGHISDFLDVVSKETKVQKERMIVCDVYNHRIHKVFKSRESLSSILDRDDIFVYELPTRTDDSDVIFVPIYQREKRTRVTGYHSSSTKVLFGNPFFVALPKKSATYSNLYQLALNKMRRFVNVADEAAVEKEEKTEEENGDIEMDECDKSENESDAELEEAYKNVTVKGDDDEEAKEDDQCTKKKTDSQKPQKKDVEEKTSKKNRLFDLSLVNMYGTTDIQALSNDGKPLKLTNQCYVSLDWNSKMKEKCYDAQMADDREEHESVYRKTTQKKNVVRLHDCIKLFLTKEKLGAKDPWYCPTCKKHQQATKKFDLWSLPEVLVVHLKRFSYTSFWRDKLDTLVDFPLSGLDLSEYQVCPDGPQPIYDLIAVSNHYGGMGGGHYTAYARNHEDDQWYSYDDSSVTPIDENQIVSKAAYVLFYQRRKKNGSEIKQDGRIEDEKMSEQDHLDEEKSANGEESMDTK